MKRGYVQGKGVRLAYVDFGGSGPGLLMLHGLMGRATTWLHTAEWLTPRFHVVGLDQRGHGLSDKPDNAYSREDYVDDAIAAIERLGLGPTVLIGHSMGALNAWVAAAKRPDLVRGLVIEDMGAATSTRDSRADFGGWFDTWPVPFPSLAAVRAFFRAQRPSFADYFIEVMTEADDGYRPLFTFEHMLQSCDGWQHRDWWAELEAVRCPALVVKGADSAEPREEMREMARRLPDGRYVEVAGAGHVIHYDQPEGWRAAVEAFLLSLARAAKGGTPHQ
ncbi:MAG: alpha/beta fold hydrolase [Bacillota bacterium]